MLGQDNLDLNSLLTDFGPVVSDPTAVASIDSTSLVPEGIIIDQLSTGAQTTIDWTTLQGLVNAGATIAPGVANIIRAAEGQPGVPQIIPRTGLFGTGALFGGTGGIVIIGLIAWLMLKK